MIGSHPSSATVLPRDTTLQICKAYSNEPLIDPSRMDADCERTRGRGDCDHLLRVEIEGVNLVNSQHRIVAAPSRLTGENIRHTLTICCGLHGDERAARQMVFCLERRHREWRSLDETVDRLEVANRAEQVERRGREDRELLGGRKLPNALSKPIPLSHDELHRLPVFVPIVRTVHHLRSQPFLLVQHERHHSWRRLLRLVFLPHVVQPVVVRLLRGQLRFHAPRCKSLLRRSGTSSAARAEPQYLLNKS